MPEISFENFGLNARLLRPPTPMERIHHHQEVELNYLFSGGATYLHHWRQRRLLPKRLTVFWGAIPHILLRVEPGTELAWITVPLPWLHQWNLPDAFMHALMEGEWWTEHRTDAEPERYPVRAWVQELAGKSDTQHEALLLEVRACLLRLAVGKSAPARSHAVTTRATAWQHVETMARFMAEHFWEDITVADVAGSAKLHPKYAMPLFRRTCGLTIRNYLLQHRLTHAQRQLIATDVKVIDIALASGFRSQSAFYETFTRVTGRTPVAFRRQMA
jgi:AraC-like DNA-binding protein